MIQPIIVSDMLLNINRVHIKKFNSCCVVAHRGMKLLTVDQLISAHALLFEVSRNYFLLTPARASLGNDSCRWGNVCQTSTAIKLAPASDAAVRCQDQLMLKAGFAFALYGPAHGMGAHRNTRPEP